MKTLGIAGKDDFYSRFFRESKITRSEALNRLQSENEVIVDALKVLTKAIGMDYLELEKLNYAFQCG